MSRSKKRDKTPPPKPAYRWTPLQQFAGYALTAVFFLSVVLYVSQSIEMKNVAYAMRDLMSKKQFLIVEKQELELALLEKQRLDQVKRTVEELDLPLTARPRLEIVLHDEIDAMPRPGEASSEEDLSWRNWLARMNQAHAMMTSIRRPDGGWAGPNQKKQSPGVTGKSNGS
jgi:hypothetical protein